MLDYRPRSAGGAESFTSSEGLFEASEAWLREILRIIQRRLALILSVIAVCGMLGGAYLFVAAKVFSATATILVGANRVSIMASEAASMMGSTESFVESQVQILQSEAIAQRVINKLKLMDDPEFNGERPGLVGRTVNGVLDGVSTVLPSFVSLEALRFGVRPGQMSEERRDRLVMTNLLRNVTVTRPVRTFVLRLSYSSSTPTKAAAIANAFADAFMVDQLEVQYEQTRRATSWLNERLDELRGHVEEAERKVEAFRAANNLTAASGRLISDQQIQELDSQLTVARSNVVEARAKLAQIESILKSGSDPSAMPEALTSQAIAQLKSQFTDVTRSVADLSNRYGERHPLVQSAIDQQAGIRRLIDEEVKRIAQTYKNQVDVAIAREDSLRQSYAELEARNVQSSKAQIVLRELERDAVSTRTVYERFLNRFKEISANENLPSPDARVLAPASPPASAEKPKSLLIMLGSIIGGAIAGFGAAFLIEHLHAGLRTRQQVEKTFNLPFLGFVPLVRGRAQKLLTHYAVDHPLSQYAEAIRSLRMAIRFSVGSDNTKIVAMASALPAEGKSTTSLNLANYAAVSGTKTLLIDADMRRPTATALMGVTARYGLAEVLRGECGLDQAIMTDKRTGLSFLPTVGSGNVAGSAELLASEEFTKLLSRCRKDFDLVVIDVSPILPVIDGRIVISQVDKVVMVVEWNSTTQQVVGEALQFVRMWRESVLGIILNKADMKRIHHYESYNVKSYSSQYPSYFGRGA